MALVVCLVLSLLSILFTEGLIYVPLHLFSFLHSVTWIGWIGALAIFSWLLSEADR